MNLNIGAKNPFSFNLDDYDAKLLRRAIEKYKQKGMAQGDLIRKIISSWLFSNQLQIENG